MNSWSTGQVVAAVAGALALVLLLVLVVLALRSAARTRRDLTAALAQSREESRALAERLAAIERARPRTDAAQPAGVIEGRVPEEHAVPTGHDERAVVLDGRIEGRLFADLVARATVIRAAGLAHGLRRALAPETRNRIRFEMRREAKRARRERRAEMREALREFRARERRAEDAA